MKNNSPSIQLLVEKQDIQKSFSVMQQLRPHLKKENYADTIITLQNEGYQLAALIKDNDIKALAGFRVAHNLFMGRHLYVDDLISEQDQRSLGYGELLITWLREFAIKENCSYLHLDSGTHRHEAHKFYFKQGFNIASYHFSEKLK